MNVFWKGLLVILIAGHGLFAIANIPFMERASNGPGDTYIPYIHHGYLDYFTYLTFIREGKEGGWKARALYTTEPTEPAFLYAYYLGLGNVARIADLNPVEAYAVGRLIALECFLLGLYLLVFKITKGRRTVASILVGLFSVPPVYFFWTPLFSDGIAPIGWDNLTPIYRIDYVPHHQFGIGLLFISLYLFLRYAEHRRIPDLAGSAFTAFIASLVYPAPGIAAGMIPPIATCIFHRTHIRKQMRLVTKDFLASCSVGFASLAGLLIVRNEMLRGFPWDQWTKWDLGLWESFPHFDKYFIVGSGYILLPAIPILILKMFRPGTMGRAVTVALAIVPWILLPFASDLGIAKIRLAFMGQFVAIGILAVEGVGNLSDWIPRKKWRYVVQAVFLSVFIMLTLPTIQHFYRENENFHTNIAVPQMHMPLDVMHAFSYFAEAVDYPVVLSNEQVGNMMPAFVPVRVYFGHEVHTKDYIGKMKLVHAFYRGDMGKDEANRFIRENRIAYIFNGPTEAGFGEGFLKYQIPMRVVFSNESVRIYELANE